MLQKDQVQQVGGGHDPSSSATLSGVSKVFTPSIGTMTRPRAAGSVGPQAEVHAKLVGAQVGAVATTKTSSLR